MDTFLVAHHNIYTRVPALFDVLWREGGVLSETTRLCAFIHTRLAMAITHFIAFTGLLAIAQAANPTHYPPSQSSINNFTVVLNGTGAPGIFNSSTSPDSVYGVYNWCNMPHVRKREYKTPPKNYTLEYVEVIQRHHKRTPYASNTFFKEDVSWSCGGEGARNGAESAKGASSNVPSVQWQALSDSTNPWVNTVGPGFVNSTCQFPQITSSGLDDSVTHGNDLRSVYFPRLSLSSKFDSNKVSIRVTNNVITSQVASGLLAGLFPTLSSSSNIPVQIQSSTYDSLEPTYSCPKANTLKSQFTTGADGAVWQTHLTAVKSLYAKLDSVSGIDPTDGGWHASLDHYYDNLSAKQCHEKKLPCSLNDTSLCVSQDEANTVYRLGSYEYSYLYRDAPLSTTYSVLKYGAWMLELKAHIQAHIDGTSEVKYLHNIAHDGSISPLLGFLQIEQMVWPGMGSEVVFELYSSGSKKSKQNSIRVLWSGQPMHTSTPLGVLDMVPVEDFFAYIDSMVGSGSELLAACNS
ncbi:phosphoglycerate mutase-like protein [Crucibulum laeve]|uniref:Phosphoglycerate mutase-like protein n=1 Tax=Crucibulum laeve TaxID=68775 RepID=A0A5C3LTQ2_9AGAR|nr:phosphoglycerate mutase-like protein [Crucibulum laeve]